MANDTKMDTKVSNGIPTSNGTEFDSEDTLTRLRRQSEFDRSLDSGSNGNNGSDGFNYSSILRVRNVQKGSYFRIWLLAVGRFFLLVVSIVTFALSMIVDRIFVWNRLKRQKKQAKRLFFIIADVMRGAMIKVGQQLSLRYDLLPHVYCEELSYLLDDVPPFKIKKATRIIEKQLGKKIEEVFDEELSIIGSASIACVYRSRLLDGSPVAIKVRRPGIVLQFVADLKAMDWFLRFMEFLNVITYGNTRNLREELHDILMEELNFHSEIRYQELFKKYFDENKELQVSAPAVYYEYSGKEVIVSEFINGISVNDVLRAIEQGDESQLHRIEEFGVNPEVVAKRLVKASFYGLFECPFFHGDPHPANIFIQKKNKIIMVDFGACGTFSNKERTSMHEMHYYYAKNDVGGMVRALVSLMEPLPPMDVDGFMKELENKWWIEYYGIKSDHPQWWERTSMGLWLSLLTLGRKHKIPLPSRMLRMVRATLLYDTVAARLYRKIDVFHEYRKYYKEKSNEAKWDLKIKTFQQMVLGPDDEQYMRVSRLISLGEAAVFKLEKLISRPIPNFGKVTKKVYEAIRIGVRWFFNLTLLSVVTFALARYVGEGNEDFVWYDPRSYFEGEYGLLEFLITAWLIIVFVYTFSMVIRLYNRFGEKDI